MHRLYSTPRACIFHKDRPVTGCLHASVPFAGGFDTYHPKTKAPKLSKSGNKNVRDSAPIQTTGLAVQFDTHCCGREALPHSKQKRGNVEEPPRQKARDGTPRKSIFCAWGWSTLSPMDVESRLRLAKDLPPSTPTTHVRERNTEKMGGIALSTGFMDRPFVSGSLVFTLAAAWAGWRHLDRAVACRMGSTFRRRDGDARVHPQRVALLWVPTTTMRSVLQRKPSWPPIHNQCKRPAPNGDGKKGATRRVGAVGETRGVQRSDC